MMGMSHARELWREWGLEVMVILCLADQIFLAIFARRSLIRFRNRFIKFLVRLLYSLLAVLSTYTIGLISFKLGVSSVQSGSLNEEIKLMAFWAPILVIFLGGPDTINALSLKDNELWKGQLLTVASQLVGACNIIILARLPTYLKCLAIIMSVVAAIKCFEKIWVLWKTSSEKLRISMHSPKSSLGYPIFKEQYALWQREGYRVRFHEIVEVNVNSWATYASAHGAQYLHAIDLAGALLPSVSRLFADHILSYDDGDASATIFRSIGGRDNRRDAGTANLRSVGENAFRVVEIELYFMYELLHTKAEWLYSLKGLVARSATSLLTLGVSIAFIFFSTGGRSKHYKFDRILTGMLLFAVSVQEFSTLLAASIQYSPAVSSCYRRCTKAFISIISLIIRHARQSEEPRWSNSVGQFSLLEFLIRKGTCWPVFGKLLGAFDLEKSWHSSDVQIDKSLKTYLYYTLSESYSNNRVGRSNQFLEEIRKILEINRADDLTWSAPTTVGETSGTGMEFDHSILVWHLATELCYHDDPPLHNEAGQTTVRDFSQMSQQLSRYMAYLLVNYPFMLPDGISHIRIRDTEATASGFFKDTENLDQARKKLLGENAKLEPRQLLVNTSKSVLFEAAWLASALNSDCVERREKKWEIIFKVWLQFIVIAAKKSRGRDHAKQLSNGGEFLTQVWMMMAHFGLTDHFQIGSGTAIERLVHE